MKEAQDHETLKMERMDPIPGRERQNGSMTGNVHGEMSFLRVRGLDHSDWISGLRPQISLELTAIGYW